MMSASRRAVLVALPSFATSRSVAKTTPSKFRHPVSVAPPCESFDLEMQRIEWALESERMMVVAGDAILTSELYAALAEGNLGKASDAINTMTDEGRLDVTAFEADVRFARLQTECETA
jgi:hypothetical protein